MSQTIDRIEISIMMQIMGPIIHNTRDCTHSLFQSRDQLIEIMLSQTISLELFREENCWIDKFSCITMWTIIIRLIQFTISNHKRINDPCYLKI